MGAFIVRRLLTIIPTLFLVATLVFVLVRLAPGGPFDSEKNVSDAIKRNLEARYQLDQPYAKQYWNELKRVSRGDFGLSMRLLDFSVNKVIGQGFPVSASLGIFAMVFALTLQTALLGAYLVATDRPGLAALRAHWRASLLAGFAGALASIGWLTAFAMRSAVDVRVVGLVEVLYSYALSRRYFAEPVSRRELAGMVLVLAGIVVIGAWR